MATLAKDVQYLTRVVESLDNGAMLKENLDELQQTVNLMQSDNHDEFYDITVRNRKYGRVDALNGPILLEKFVSVSLCSKTIIINNIADTCWLKQIGTRSNSVGPLSTATG